ncbi:MAG: serine hydrolase [Bacteroidota bacterium]|nr:serine hydrolase [Bacteroidota bacterium]MEE3244858.1 serine hydrolase [Bacteroidota bacterium]
MKKVLICIPVILLTLAFAVPDSFYPIDGYERTGIDRLAQLEKIVRDSIAYNRIPAGAYLSVEDIKLRLTGKQDSAIAYMTEDAEFQKKIGGLFYGLDQSYSISVLDMTDSTNLKYAARNETRGYQPGSVGKLAILIAMFDQLEKLCPDDWGARVNLLKYKRVKGGPFAVYDHHTIPVYDIEQDKLTRRTAREDDVFSLYEWIDHMVAVSNNGAASVVYREALLLKVFGEKYFDLTDEEAMQWFKDTDRGEVTRLANEVVNEPLRAMGITEDEWRLGGFFTNGGERYVGRMGGSIGSPKGLMKFLVNLEQGKAVDSLSSLEMKRIMYQTERRIRYAYSHELDSAAVYFKSGSFYKCDKSKGACGDYAGNVFNYMNSVIIVEHPDDGPKYIVCLMTNVLRKNSATDHMYLASRIDKVLQEVNQPKASATGQ